MGRFVAAELGAALSCAVALCGPFAPAAVAAGGPNPDCSVGWIPQTVVGGVAVNVRASAPEPHQWAVTFEGRTERFNTSTLDEQLATPAVSAARIDSLSVTCSGADGSRTWRFDVELLPAAGGASPVAAASSGTDLPTGSSGQSDFNWLPIEVVIVVGCLLLFGLNFAQKQRRP